jgi:hypothetical protein
VKKYKVEVCFTAWKVVDVVAESQSEAIQKACDGFPSSVYTNAAKADHARSFVATEEDFNESLLQNEIEVLNIIGTQSMTWFDIDMELSSKRNWIPDSMIEKGFITKTHQGFSYYYAATPKARELLKAVQP